MVPRLLLAIIVAMMHFPDQQLQSKPSKQIKINVLIGNGFELHTRKPHHTPVLSIPGVQKELFCPVKLTYH